MYIYIYNHIQQATICPEKGFCDASCTFTRPAQEASVPHSPANGCFRMNALRISINHSVLHTQYMIAHVYIYIYHSYLYIIVIFLLYMELYGSRSKGPCNHVGIVNYNDRQCCTIRPRESLFWARESVVYLAKELAKVYLDEVSKPA